MDVSQHASLRVLHIPELLEVILWRTLDRQFPPPLVSKDEPGQLARDLKEDRDVLESNAKGIRWMLCSASRVNRFWNQTVNSSPAIQKSMFLSWTEKADAGLEVEIEYNPLLAVSFTWGYFHMRINSKDAFESASTDAMPREDPDWLRVLQYKNASWRRMYPALPPPSKVRFFESERADGENGSLQSKFRRGVLDFATDGLVMGMLSDVIETWLESIDGKKWFQVGWHEELADDSGYIRMEYTRNFAFPRKFRNSLDGEDKFHVDIILGDLSTKGFSNFPGWKSEGCQWALPSPRDWE